MIDVVKLVLKILYCEKCWFQKKVKANMAYLIEKLDANMWQQAKTEDDQRGFELYHIGRAHENKGNNVFHYAVSAASGARTIAVLEGAKGNNDPLKGVANCQLKLKDSKIVGIDVAGDVVIAKQ